VIEGVASGDAALSDLRLGRNVSLWLRSSPKIEFVSSRANNNPNWMRQMLPENWVRVSEFREGPTGK
jgi:hypothetical protein